MELPPDIDENNEPKYSKLIAAQNAAIKEAKALSLQSNIFCVSLLCIEGEYGNHAIEFIRAAFSLFADRDYCVATVPTTLAEIPLLRTFTPIPIKQGKTSSYVFT